MGLFAWLKRTWNRFFGTRNRVEILIVENRQGFIQASIRWSPDNFPPNERNGKDREKRICDEVAAVLCSLATGELWPTIEQSLTHKVETLQGADYGLGLAIIRQYSTYRKNKLAAAGLGQLFDGFFEGKAAANSGESGESEQPSGQQPPGQPSGQPADKSGAPLVRPTDVFRKGE